MADIVYHKSLLAIIRTSNDFIIEASFIEVNYTDEIKEICSRLAIQIEKIQNKLRLLTNSIQTKVFSSIEAFLKIREINDDSNFLILDNSDSFSYINQITYKNLEFIPNFFLISNTKNYLEFLNFLKEQEKEIEGTFHFVDSYNKDLRKITFVSLSEKGRLNISYKIEAPLFNNNQDLRNGFINYKKCFEDENKSLIKFLKSSTIKIVSNYSAETRLKQYFENLSGIVENARMNFEVYLNELSIDKIKKDYDDVKSKYFNGLSDILSKLSQNIIALPIGIAALLFAIEKLKENPTFLCLLIPTILVTSIYLSLLLRVYFKDLIYILKVFNFDYSVLIENNFFKKYPKETTLFEEIKTRVYDRVQFLKLIIESYFWIMNLSNVFILGVLFSYLKITELGIISISIVILIYISIARNYVLDKAEKEEN